MENNPPPPSSEMSNLTEMLKQLGPGELERLLQQVKQTKTDVAAVEPSPATDATPLPTATHSSETPALPALVPNEEIADTAASNDLADVPLSELFASAGDTVLTEEDLAQQREEKLKKDAEKALAREKLHEEKLRKDAEKALEKERAQEEKLQREAEKAREKERQIQEKAKKELEKAVTKFEKEEEKERQKLEKDEERDSQKLLKDDERERQRILKEEEKEQARLQKLEEARQAAAAKASANQPVTSLSAFGFFAQATKQPAETVNRLFPPFVPDRRIVPVALRFWESPHERKSNAVDEEETSVMVTEGPRHTVAFPQPDEESSLMHPPVGAHVDATTTDPDVQCSAPYKLKFNDMIERAAGGDGKHCPCTYHTHATTPVSNFDSEVVLAGFYAIGYDPCQSRPPYFGTLNHLQEGNLNPVELLRLGRFPVNQEIPRLSTLDYDYDSGDDWDVLEDDEDIAASSNDSDDGIDSLDSSDLDFIDDDDDDSDPDCELQRKIVEARQRRMHRLAGKDKLIPSYSGPFVGVCAAEHPLSHCDCLDRFKALDDCFFEAMLETELTRLESSTSHGADSEAKREQKLLEAALKNRREMLEDELEAMHRFIAINSKVTPKAVADALHEQHLCAGVARAEITRSVKRFYERKHSMLIRREVPWTATDDRLFIKAASKKTKGSGSTDAEKTTEDSVLKENEEENDADDEVGCDENQETLNGNPDGAGAAPAETSPSHEKDVPKGAGLSVLQLLDRKRGRDETSSATEEVVISVAATDETDAQKQ